MLMLNPQFNMDAIATRLLSLRNPSPSPHMYVYLIAILLFLVRLSSGEIVGGESLNIAYPLAVDFKTRGVKTRGQLKAEQKLLYSLLHALIVASAEEHLKVKAHLDYI